MYAANSAATTTTNIDALFDIEIAREMGVIIFLDLVKIC